MNGPNLLSALDLERARARESEALGRFFDCYFDRAYGLIFRLCGDRAVAEDLTQETFLKVHRALDTLDASRDPWPWVATIAANTCRDHWSSSPSRLRRASQSIEEAHLLRDARPGPDDALEQAEQAALVRRALEEIPPPARAVVLLHDWQGFSHDEIAEMLGRSHGAIRQQYRRAIAAIAKVLGAPRR